MAETHMGVLDLVAAKKADRRRVLETEFCRLLNQKLQHEQGVKNCEAEMFRIQGRLAELDHPDPTGSG